MTKLVNRAKMTTATTGTGTLTLNSAVDGYQDFSSAGVVNSDVVRYTIEDGDAWEIGSGTYSAGTLTRVLDESSTGSLLNLSGDAVVYVTVAAEDIVQPSDLATVATTGSYNDLSDQPTIPAAYTNSDVDTHLNTGTASSGEVLSWNGSDYDWVAVSGGATDIDGLSDGYYFSQSLGLGTGAMVNNSGSFLGNTAVGYYAGNLTSTGNLNTFIGREAGDTNTTGRWNTFVGANTSGDSATTQDSVVVGYNSQATSNAIVVGSDAKALGSGQVSIGDEAGRSSNSSANESVLIGRAAGQYVQGSRNIGIGSYSLFSFGAFSLTGSNNVALGYQTGYDLSSGAYNFLGGYQAGANLTTGSNNVALGNGALDAATVGEDQIAIGRNAMGLGVNTATGTNAQNIAIGTQALEDITSGIANIAIGKEALKDLTTAITNVAIGRIALAGTVGNGNVAIGDRSGSEINGGANNTFIGTDSGWGTGLYQPSGSNNSCFGYQAQGSTDAVSNEITLGNSSIATLRCQVTTITSLSDARDKTDIQPLNAGLEFVNALEPVSFTWNMRDGGKVGEADTGFIAQDLKRVQEETGVTIPHLVFDANPEKLEAGYGKLIPVLVQAIKDLSAKVDELEAKLKP